MKHEDIDDIVAIEDASLRWRLFKDRSISAAMAFGGVSVIIAVLLIAFYLVYVVIPLFLPARMEQVNAFDTPAQPAPLYAALEEYGEIGVYVTPAPGVAFFHTATGKVFKEHRLPLPPDVKVTSFASGDAAQASLVLGLSDGTALLVKHSYRISYPDDRRHITPVLEFPLGEAPLTVDARGRPLERIAVQSDAEQTIIAAAVAPDQVRIVKFVPESSLSDDAITFSQEEAELTLPIKASYVLVDVDQTELYAISAQGEAVLYDVSGEPRLAAEKKLLPDDARVSAVGFLSGGISLVVGDSQGRLAQWFPVRQDTRVGLQRVREFTPLESGITAIVPEFYRKGFIAADGSGHLAIYHATAHRTLLTSQVSNSRLYGVAISPRASAMLVLDGEHHARFFRIENEHPEISWSSLWGSVWYESRPEPDFIWQSSSASGDFEPKFSLVPLSFGTLKAALYAMLFSVPIALCGAIYTGYFMSPRARRAIKPTIELMEALPTVILGFLAGLWLAPLVEKNLPGMLLLFIATPVAVVIAAYLWSRFPPRWRHLIPEGWEAVALLPVVVLTALASMHLSLPLERWLFAGNAPAWLESHLGLSFDQRNSMVVGIAMGFAVIPAIFSISEDAVVGVPRHLTLGSLALGATRWQTLRKIVLLTASPGMFSAVMIGLGRAVGETMIVLMATGNTPIMDMNMFQGFRALSANIAVEMPESEVDSTHYRLLFLAALVLFGITFLFNTVAEIIRQRLRKRYASL